MSDIPGGPDWFQATNGKWYPPQRPKPPEPKWVGPAVWSAFLGGILLFLVGIGSAVALVGLVVSLGGLVGLGATNRIIPRGRTR